MVKSPSIQSPINFGLNSVPRIPFIISRINISEPHVHSPTKNKCTSSSLYLSTPRTHLFPQAHIILFSPLRALTSLPPPGRTSAQQRNHTTRNPWRIRVVPRIIRIHSRLARANTNPGRTAENERTTVAAAATMMGE